MDTLLLRKLSRKSVLTFGKYEDWSVGQVIDLKHVGYLRWVYYNMSNISFLDEVLDELKIYDTWRIDKPGKDPEMGDKHTAYMRSLRASYVRRDVANGDYEAIGKYKAYKKELKKKASISVAKNNYSKIQLKKMNGHKC